MFRLLNRIINLAVIAAFIAWAYFGWHLLQVQPQTTPPAGFPANAAACVSGWAGRVQFAPAREASIKECNTYYALLGDRTAPIHDRMKAQYVTRLTSLMITEYMRRFPPTPNQVVSISGQQVVWSLGFYRVWQMLRYTVTHGDRPYSAIDMLEARCRLEHVLWMTSQRELNGLQQKCTWPR